MRRVVRRNDIPTKYLVERLNRLVECATISIGAWFNARPELERTSRSGEQSWPFAFELRPDH